MAGDWIKMRVDIGDDPAVISLAGKLNIAEDEVVGKLHRLWSWADRHTTDGTAIGITIRWVDKYVALSGFAECLVSVGWLEFNSVGVVFPNFDRHNGQSAKQRAEAAIRQRLSRKNRDEGITGLERDNIPRPFVRAVLERDGYQCVFCGVQSSMETEESKRKKLSIDHLIPITRGGLSAVHNLVCACRQCNMEKSDRTPEEWGMLPEFLQNGVTYKDGKMSHKTCDKTVTREEKIREEVNLNPLSDKSDVVEVSNPEHLKDKPADLTQSAKRVLEFLNLRTGHNYRPVKSNIAMIVARLKEGYTEQELRTVTMRKVNEWGTDEKMADYLRPKTLYNATNFNSYAGILT